MGTNWAEIEKDFLRILSLPHNVVALKEDNETPQSAARRVITDMKSGLAGVASPKEFVGPKLFLRVVGPANAAYAGRWWLDADVFSKLEAAYSRIYFKAADRKRVIRDMLREVLAIPTEINEITEVWALALPLGERLAAYVGTGAPQKLFANMRLSAECNRMLVGGIEQIVFPVKNPLWVEHYANLSV
jgi:hypothetical protein